MSLKRMTAFPARAGMNRPTVMVFACGNRVPRTRGNEPTAAMLIILVILRSPHARG